MDAGELSGRLGPSWNPLRSDGTALPASWLLAAKLLAFSLFPGTRVLAAGPPFLPFFRVFDWPMFAPWLAPATAVVVNVAFLCLLFNRLVRPAAATLAACVFVHVAAHRLEYGNNLLFTGVLLLVIALYDARWGLWPLRIQLALVYAGSSLNKALDADWWNGRYFDTLMVQALDVRWYGALAATMPEHRLGSIFGALTVAIEAAIAIAMLAGRDGGRAGVVLLLAFHLAMLAATSGQLSLPFLYAGLAVSVPFLNLAIRTPVMWWLAALSIRLLPRLLGRA